MAPAVVVALLFTSPAMATTIFVSNEQGNTVTVIDSKTLKTIKTIPVSRRPAASS
jgi:YVTN family beta-propeller protein